MGDPGHDEFMRVIDDALEHRADNSDAALIARGCDIRLRMGGPFDRPRTVQVTYDDRAYWARIGPGGMRHDDVRYFVIVETWQENGVIHGKIVSKPKGIETMDARREDPQIQYLRETGATP